MDEQIILQNLLLIFFRGQILKTLSQFANAGQVKKTAAVHPSPVCELREECRRRRGASNVGNADQLIRWIKDNGLEFADTFELIAAFLRLQFIKIPEPAIERVSHHHVFFRAHRVFQQPVHDDDIEAEEFCE